MSDKTFTDANFKSDVLDSSTPVVVDFWAPWCGPCRIVSPTIEELAKDYEGRVLVGKMNVDDNPETAGQYGVMSIPTIMIFKGGQPAKSIIGAQGKESYKRAIDEAVASA
ncbi:MAG TPA: thioredoxin [Xanthomonadales bacterium]|nr:thioredoxin [Xanthomonadales bacterium]